MPTKTKEEEPAAAAEETCEECPVRVWTSAMRDFEGGFRSLLPEEFWQHRRAAHREALLAVRSLLDGAIERLDKEPGPRSRKGPTKIAVQ